MQVAPHNQTHYGSPSAVASTRSSAHTTRYVTQKAPDVLHSLLPSRPPHGIWCRDVQCDCVLSHNTTPLAATATRLHLRLPLSTSILAFDR